MSQKEARDFSSGINYGVGDLALKDGILYVFTSQHSAGAWDADDVAEYDTNEINELTRILAGMDNAVKATEYVGTIKLIPSIIEGTRYKYILTDAPDPRK